MDLIEELPAFIRRRLPYRRRAVEVLGHRVTAIDHEVRGAERTVVMFHGNPTWSFLWRKTIAALESASDARGWRLVAPDLVGFGTSDKPRHPSDHTVSMHVDTMTEALVALRIRRPILVGQDWGGPIAAGVGMRLAARGEPPIGFVFANTAVIAPRRPFRPKAFHRFSHVPVLSDVAFRGLMFPVPLLSTTQGDRKSIGPAELAAYAWPFRRLRDRAGSLGLARMVPNAESHPSTALLDEIAAFLRAQTVPMALVWGRRDPILGRALDHHVRAFPNASVRECEAGHFLQEEVPELLADAIREVASKAG